jgi:flagellar basal body-associated protein FliL
MAGKGEDKAKKDEQSEGGGGKGKKGLPKLLIIGIVLLVVVGTALVAGRVVAGKRDGKHGKSAKKEAVRPGATMTLEEFLVNLADDGHYMKTTIALGLKPGLSEEKMKEHLAPIRDAIVSVLSSMRASSLSSEEGKIRLKKLLTDRINREVPDEPVVAVYFTAFTTQ